MMAVSDGIRVTFLALSGDSFTSYVSRGVSASALYATASAGMKGLQFDSSFLLSLDWVILPDDSQPFASTPACTNATVHVVKQSPLQGFRVLTFIDLLKQRLWGQAAACFYASTCKRLLAEKRDESGDSILAWAAYKAGNSCEALGLLHSIMNYCPGDACRISPTSSTLPLHDAAWGNASPEVAVLLCAAFPGACNVRCGGQTPTEVGVYHHGAAFRWPSFEDLVDRAQLLRQQLKIGQTLVACHRRQSQLKSTSSLAFVMSECLGVPRSVTKVLAEFLLPVFAPKVTLQHAIAKQTERQNSVVVASLPGMQRRQQPIVKETAQQSRATQLEASDSDVHDINIPCNHLNEASRKERGRLAGARRMRGRHRCSFRETCHVQVGDRVVHRIVTHAVHSVFSDKHRAALRWPSKACWRRERAFERAEKLRMRALQ